MRPLNRSPPTGENGGQPAPGKEETVLTCKGGGRGPRSEHMGGGDSSSSSGEEDGNAEWRSAIDSVAIVNVGASAASGQAKHRRSVAAAEGSDPDLDGELQLPKEKSRAFNLCQLKAQKFLNDILERSLLLVTDPPPVQSEKQQTTEGGVRLFRKCARGIRLVSIDSRPQPRKRPRIAPGEEIKEKSKVFRQQLKSVTVDGDDITRCARKASQQALSRFEARDAARRAAERNEEERVANLKKLRGEKWLPSVAREMKVQVKVGRGKRS